MVKRLNFNLSDECHALLKGVCALKGETVSDYVLNLINDEFNRLVKEDNQVQSLVLNGTYKEGCWAYRLKESLIEELNTTNDPSA